MNGFVTSRKFLSAAAPKSLMLMGAALLTFACSGGGTNAGAGTRSVSSLTQAGTAAPGAAAPGQNTLTLAVKFVSYTDPSGKPSLPKEAVAPLIQQMNQLMAQCGIAYTAGDYQSVDPTKMGLDFGLTSMDELDPTRAKFDDPKQLVVIDTGAWDHGSMGTANAWTAMPGQSPSGAVIEGPVANYANIVAHELGHYLNLDHVDDQSDLMNPIIYDASTHLDAGQCNTVREAAQGVRAQALR